jgi:hypothetical protein
METDAYANQWQDILSEKDSELYATANALGNIVLVDSLKVAEVVRLVLSPVFGRTRTFSLEDSR